MAERTGSLPRTGCQSVIPVFIHFEISVIGHDYAVYFTTHEAQDGDSFCRCFYCHFFFGNNILPGI
ncbi:hypothetical protein [Komagataeibacter europaeus]|uniref:hypothetical protein n=1 Tax=Komagataeibacter europaeus TaxID=33995 RepID=UPI0009E4FE11|nr:hypothetical protein [Komagataeibacter europaeus]